MPQTFTNLQTKPHKGYRMDFWFSKAFAHRSQSACPPQSAALLVSVVLIGGDLKALK